MSDRRNLVSRDHNLVPSHTLVSRSQNQNLVTQTRRNLLHYMPGCHSHTFPAGLPLPGERVSGSRLGKKEERRQLPLSFIEEDARQQLMMESKGEMNRHSLTCLGPPDTVETSSLRRAISSTALRQRQSEETHDQGLLQLKKDAATSWIFAVRGDVVRQRACDEVSEEFRRAGIGHCFRGLSLFLICNSFLSLLTCRELFTLNGDVIIWMIYCNVVGS